MKNKVAVILAGGKGTRLKPMTEYLNKHLLPIYNKPMIYYPLSIAKRSGIKKIYLICNPGDDKLFKSHLGNGKNFDLNIEYLIQKKPNGIAGGLKLLENKIPIKTKILLLLGDNIFVGQGLQENYLSSAFKSDSKFTIFSVFSYKPENFGVIQYKKNKPMKIIEKPKKFISNDIVTGMYVFDSECLSYIRKIKLSKFKQYEITDFINLFIKENEVKIIKFGAGMAWIDCGEPETLFEAAQMVKFYNDKFGINLGYLG